MRDVIEKLIETEAGAKRIVQAAHAEAALLLTAARRQADEMISMTREAAHVEGAAIITAARWEARRGTLIHLAAAERDLAAVVAPSPETLEQIIDAVVGCVTCRP